MQLGLAWIVGTRGVVDLSALSFGESIVGNSVVVDVDNVVDVVVGI